MTPQEVPSALVKKATEAVIKDRWGDWAGDIGPGTVEIYRKVVEVALAATLSVEEVWVGGPGALPLPPQVITHEGVFYEDGVTPLEITDEAMRAGGWKKRQRLVSEWEER